MVLDPRFPNPPPLRLSPPTYFMSLRTLFLLLLGFAALFPTAPRSLAAPLADNETLKLPSGRTVKVLSVSKVELSRGVMALMLRYQTILSVSASRALSHEVDEVWKFAVKDVEHYGYNEAIISSNEVPKGIF